MGTPTERFEWHPGSSKERLSRWLLAGLLLAVLVGLQFQTYRTATHLAEIQQQRCMERNEDSQILVDFVARQAPELGTQLRARLQPQDCGVYDR